MEKNQKLIQLLDAFVQLQSREETLDFLEDLCTMKEIQDFSDRLEVAVLLDQGLTYEQITQQTNMSSTTIARINKCLNYGKNGYRRALESLKQK